MKRIWLNSYFTVFSFLVLITLLCPFTFADSHHKFRFPKFRTQKETVDQFQNLPDEMVLKIIESSAESNPLSLLPLAQVNDRFHRIVQGSPLYPSALATTELCKILKSVKTKNDVIKTVWGIAHGLKHYHRDSNPAEMTEKLGNIHSCIVQSFDKILNRLIRMNRIKRHLFPGDVNLLVALGMLQYPRDLGDKIYEKIWTLATFPQTNYASSRGMAGFEAVRNLTWPILNQFIKRYGQEWALSKIFSTSLPRLAKGELVILTEGYQESSLWELMVDIHEVRLQDSTTSIRQYDVIQWDKADSNSAISSFQKWSVPRDDWETRNDKFLVSDMNIVRLRPTLSDAYLERINDAGFLRTFFIHSDTLWSHIVFWRKEMPKIYYEIARTLSTQQKDFSIFESLIAKGFSSLSSFKVWGELTQAEENDLEVIAAIAQYSPKEWAEKQIVPSTHELKVKNISAKIYAALVLGPYRNDSQFQETLIHQLDQFSRDVHVDSLVGALAITSHPSQRLQMFSRMKQVLETGNPSSISKRRKKHEKISWNISQSRIAALVGLATR
jgi:hypothetical protein